MLLCGMIVFGQDPRGTITGRVTDPSNAAMVGVRVRATNEATQVTASTTTSETGNFVIPFLPPGIYSVSAESAGFKKFSRPGIRLRVGEVAEISVPMVIGGLEETVSVTSEAPLLETASSSLAQVVDERRIHDLPLFAGNPLELMFITPGTVNASSTMPQLHAPWNGVQLNSNGNPNTSNDFSIDGVSNNFPNGIARGVRPAFSPPTTAVSEFRIETVSYDASVGHSAGASVNVNTKGGTNKLHWGAHWFVKNSAFDAPSFFDNQAGRKVEAYRYNRPGFDIGGPVGFPGYDGRNRTFFFYTYERNIWQVPEPRTDTVPTLRQRTGDFSELLALGMQYQIYDPFSAAPAPNGRFMRMPLPNNAIPQSRMDPVGRNMVNLYPEPNLPGNREGVQNYHTPAVATQDYWVHLARVDHNFNDRNRMFVRLDVTDWFEDQLRRLGRTNPASGLLTSSANKGAALDYVRVLGSSTVLNFRYGLTFHEAADHRASRGWDLASLGFSPRLVSLIDARFATIPEANIDSYARMSRFWTGDGSNTGLTHSLNGNFTHVHRAHSLKFGSSLRAYRSFGNRFPYSTSPFFRLTPVYTRGPLDNSANSPIGQALAGMLLGLPTEASFMELSPSFALNGPSLGLYFQDDYKLSRKLTVSLGLRWEHDLPVTERFDRLVAQFDAGVANPVEAAARANYARNPIAEIAVSDFSARGGLTWVSQGGAGRSPFTSSQRNFLPRVGIAYQIAPKTVLRTGYGIFFDTVGVNQTVPIQTGFSQTTPIQVSRDGGLTFVTRASDPFPSGLLQPLGPAAGLRTNLNQSLNFYNPFRKTPYSQRWSLGIQHLLPAQTVVDMSYVANRGTRLEIPRNINGVPNRYLSTSFVRDQASIDRLSQRVTNPFLGTDPIFASTAARVDLLRPYPHFGSIVVDEPIGYSWYHALQLRLDKRLGNGFTVQGAYTFSKLMQATEFLNAGDPMPYETPAPLDRTHIVSITGLAEIPFGRGRRFGASVPGVIDAIAGGWQFAVLFRHQSGQPLEFGDAIFTGNLKDIHLPADQRRPERWFNTEAGFNRVVAQQRAFNVRAFPLRFGHVRSDAQRRWDLSLKKLFRIREAVTWEFRAEAINAPNSPIFGAPDTNPTSSSFGRVTGLAWLGRQFQFGTEVRF
jgi:hypothetical protein